mgnify:FL=1
MTTSDKALMDDLAAEAAEQRRAIVELLARLHVARQTQNTAKREADGLADRVKQWLDLENETEIADDERGIRAYYQSRSTTTWDVASMPDDLILILANTPGLMTINTSAFDALRRAGGSAALDDAMRFRMTGETRALQVEAVTA